MHVHVNCRSITGSSFVKTRGPGNASFGENRVLTKPPKAGPNDFTNFEAISRLPRIFKSAKNCCCSLISHLF